jgi:hypothetical protein
MRVALRAVPNSAQGPPPTKRVVSQTVASPNAGAIKGLWPMKLPKNLKNIIG